MKLLNISHRYDFGSDYYIQILNFGKHWPRPLKKRSVIQVSVSWNEYPSWPYLQISMGNNGLLGVIFWTYKFGFDVDIFSRTWNWDFLEKLDEQEADELV